MHPQQQRQQRLLQRESEPESQGWESVPHRAGQAAGRSVASGSEEGTFVQGVARVAPRVICDPPVDCWGPVYRRCRRSRSERPL